MRLAIVGSGVSGLVCAYLLSRRHEVVLYEQDTRPGGHTNTVTVAHEERQLAVDTGFIVFNERNYPNFCRLLSVLGVGSRPTTMSFSVRDDATGFEYGGTSLAGAVGSLGNLFQARWWRVMAGVLSLGREGKSLLAEVDDRATLGDLAKTGRFSQEFLEDYLIPMAAAIWSAPRDAMLRFPAKFFLRFFDNHGMLDLRERPIWRTVVGGSRAYIDAMMPGIGPRLRAGRRVVRVCRQPTGVAVRCERSEERFDHVILASHADQSLAMLADASEDERSILGELLFQPNEAVLHTDEGALPNRRRCWAAWNYRVAGNPALPVGVTYNMSLLQGLDTRRPVCVTLNDSGRIDPTRVLARFRYHHPLYTPAGDLARQEWGRISGVNRTHYCGAYWGNGFHEDGVTSALRVCKAFGEEL